MPSNNDPNPLAGLFLHNPSPARSQNLDEISPGILSSAEPPIPAALRREAELCAGRGFIDEPFRTVYIGGDRRSPTSVDVANPVLRALRESQAPSAPEEITLEVTPVDLSVDDLHSARRRGINRLSIEALSLVPDDLNDFGATHSVRDVENTVRDVRKTQFTTFSVDLCFGGREHPFSHWKTSLHRVVDWGIPHVTLHEWRPLDTDLEEDRAERLAFAMAFLRAKGFEQYELTHFARPGHRSMHQENYYEHSNYVGLGPGAESFWWSDRSCTSSARRWSNVENAEAYVEHLARGKSPVEDQQDLDQRALAREYILLRLRTSAGLDLEILEDTYDDHLRSRCGSTLERLREEGLIRDDSQRVRLTQHGRLRADAITRRLFP